MNGTRSQWGQTSAARAVPLVRYLLAVHVGALEVDPGEAGRALDHGPTGEGLATEAGHAVPTVLLGKRRTRVSLMDIFLRTNFQGLQADVLAEILGFGHAENIADL